jgi:hypothetical protein
MYLLIVLGAPPSTMRSLIILCISIFVMRRSVRIETRLRVFRVAILTIFLFSSIPSIRHTTSSSFPLPHSTIIQPRPKSPTPCTMIHKLQPSFTQPQQQPPRTPPTPSIPNPPHLHQHPHPFPPSPSAKPPSSSKRRRSFLLDQQRATCLTKTNAK